MKIFQICILLFCFKAAIVSSQTTCATSQPFCANNTSGTTFPASTNTTAEAGPSYGCLATTPNPAWYYFQVSASGNITIGISGTGGDDVDFICWGPFSTPNGNCGTSLTAGNTVDCSYSASATETCTIPNAIAGQYYTLLLTNYDNTNQNINFNQVGGTGSTNCNLIAPVTSATICAGSTATLSTNTTLSNATYLWNPGAFTTQTITISPSVTTIYTVTVSGLNASSTPTSVTNTGTVTVNNLPVITIPTTITICENSSTLITSTVSPAGTYMYSWSTGATTPNLAVNTSTVVSLTATNTTSGCVTNIATCSVTALPSPTVVTFPDYYICGGGTAIVTPTVTGGLPAYSYSWSPSGLGTADTAIVSSSGIYTIEVTDQNLCIGSSQFSVSTNQPTISIIASPNSICAAASSTLSSSLLGADSYMWSDGSSNDSLTVNTPGVYSLTIAVNGCTATTTSTIIASPTPSVTIPSTVNMCSSASTTLTTVSVSPSSTYSYTWSTGANGSTSTITNLDTLVTLVVTDMITGCISDTSNTCSVIVNSNPSPTVNTTYICSGSTSTVTPMITGGTPAYSYAWSSGLGTASVATVSSAGVYSVQVSDQNLCSGSTQFTVSSTQPTVAINVNPLSLCGAGTVTLTTTLPGASAYNWSGGSINDSLIVTTPGVYSITVTVNSCSATATNTVVISPTPTVSVPATIGMCSGASAVVTSTVSPSGSYSYTWSNGSNANSVNISTATVLTVQVTNNVTGCMSSISNSCSVVTAVNPTVTMPSLPVAFCNGFSATLTPTVSPSGSYSYSWSPSSLGTASTATTATQGTYTLQVVDQNLCFGVSSVVVVKSTPTVLLSSPDLVICPGDCAEINATGTSSFTPFTYSWSNNNLAFSDSVLACSAGTVEVTFTDAKGCIATNIITVFNDVIPVASFTSNPSSPVNPAQVIDFTSTSTIASGSITTTTWSFGDGNLANGSTVNYAYTNAGTFPVTITVSGSNGCANSYVLNYIVDAIIGIPNVFTPNGDGANDYLKFKYLEVFGSNNLIIFNRWGKKIFEQDNYNNDWNGGGHNDGTYFFILSVPNAKPSIYKGYVQLMR